MDIPKQKHSSIVHLLVQAQMSGVLITLELVILPAFGSVLRNQRNRDRGQGLEVGTSPNPGHPWG